ncbi:MAG: hypothetical protein SX243_07070 [Acidobacteriota bacterium]|nr:hypothetical protein [Acidobacteriota bacterium]
MNRVLPILATALVLALLLPAAAAQASEVQLLFHQQVVAGHEVVHASSLVPQSPPPPGGPPAPEDQALHDTVQWLTTKGLFTPPEIDGMVFDVSITADGIVIHSSWGNGNFTIILSNGPFLPQPIPQDWLVSFQMVRSIYNGI